MWESVSRGPSAGSFLTSVSRQFIALEEVLGTTLVERTTRHLSLTESGLLYYERAKQILEEVAEAERSLTAQTGIAEVRGQQNDWMTIKRPLSALNRQSSRLDDVRCPGQTGSGVSGPSGRFFTLGVAAMIQRFAHVVLQEIGIDLH
jgi:hypothetical protein